jgi:hypothetical protein
MGSSMQSNRRSEPVPHEGAIRPTSSTAVLRRRMSDRVGPPPDLKPAIYEVLMRGHGSVKAMAYTMGNTDPSLLRRQILDGTLPLKKLLEADPRALAAFGEFLLEHYGHALKSRQQLAREKLPELLALFLDAVSEEK